MPTDRSRWGPQPSIWSTSDVLRLKDHGTLSYDSSDLGGGASPPAIGTSWQILASSRTTWQYSPVTRSRAAGALFILTFLLGFMGIILFIGRETTGWFDEYDLERAFILGSWLVAATAAVLLAGARDQARRPTPLVVGIALFAVGALGAAIAEVSLLSPEFRLTSLWGVGFATWLFVGEALIGAGLLDGGLVPTWVAWTVIVWNVLWLVTLAIISRDDMYYPGLHYIPLLLIGIPLTRHSQPSAR